MIVGLFLRNFKNYRNINYIPITTRPKLSAYVGDNGIGKTAILEALNVFFTSSGSPNWIYNIEARKQGDKGAPYVLPIFIIEKIKFNQFIPPDRTSLLEAISQFFWKTTFNKELVSYDQFYKDRVELLKDSTPDSHYLLLYGTSSIGDLKTIFGGFQNDLVSDVTLKELLEINDKSDKEVQLGNKVKFIYEALTEYYDYIYIPVETNISNYTRLDNFDLQVLIDKRISDRVKDKLDFAAINQIITTFINEINASLYGKGYSYQGRRKKLSSDEIAEIIINAYFSTKELSKLAGENFIAISNLSAGDKRKALLEMAYTFLTNQHDRRKCLIVAIDEPEASLHLSSAFDQFERLTEISKMQHQVLVTTHWYGFLPVTPSCILHSISKTTTSEIQISSLDLQLYRAKLKKERGNKKFKLPYDVQIKSYSDLAHSIIASIRNIEPYNYIICEGVTEQIYLSHLLGASISKLRILPVGGASEVIRIYNSLANFLSDKEIQADVKGKIFCITDTDAMLINLDIIKNTGFEKIIVLKRLLVKPATKQINLIDYKSTEVSPATEIEHCLDGKLYFETLLAVSANSVEYSTIAGAQVQKENQISATYMDLRASEREAIDRFMNENEGFNKVTFAESYISKMKESQTPHLDLTWIAEIKKHFQ